jgi:parallel beta-helix repeat protein
MMMIRYKKIVAIAALMLLSLTLILSELAPATKANPYMADAFFGEKAPPGITIESNGTIVGTDRIVQTNDTTYILTNDLTNSITILKNGIILNGNGRTLHGKSGQVGLFIQQRDDITITNLIIEGCDSAIRLPWRNYGDTDGRTITITNNSFVGNKNAIVFSDHLQGSNITSNSFVANTNCVVGAEGIIFRNNQFVNNERCINSVGNRVNNVDTSNMINGKPIYYWINQQNLAVPSNAGSVILKNCRNILVQGLDIRSGGEIQLYNTTDSTVKGNFLSKNGLSLWQSNNNVIEDNTISDITKESSIAGLLLSSSNQNRVVKNQIINCPQGIWMTSCNSNTVSQNQVTSNMIGVHLSDTPYNYSSYDNLVSQNFISKNSIGISLYVASGSIIVLNDITDNLDWGMKFEGNPQNNSIHHNNFIGNNVTEKLQVFIPGFWKQIDTGGIVNGTYKSPQRAYFAGEANFWNSTSGGNYWSDYGTRYSNATKVGKTGVGNTPFVINENNIDYYPLMAPVDILHTQVPLPTPRITESPVYANPTQQAENPQEIGDTSQNSNLLLLLAIVLVVLVASGLTILVVRRRS